MPIESAPKSDPAHPQQKIMLWLDGAGVVFGRVYDDGEGRTMVVPDGYSGRWSIKYWMPLPPPPEKKD